MHESKNVTCIPRYLVNAVDAITDRRDRDGKERDTQERCGFEKMKRDMSTCCINSFQSRIGRGDSALFFVTVGRRAFVT